jgi:flavin-binding protein dodecin
MGFASRQGGMMATIKVVELIGTSAKSWEDAAHSALERAAKSTRNITGLDLIGQAAEVKEGKITEYRAHVKIAFVVEE